MKKKLLTSKNLIIFLLLIMAALFGAITQSQISSVNTQGQPEIESVNKELPLPTKSLIVPTIEEIQPIVTDNAKINEGRKQLEIDHIDQEISFKLDDIKAYLESHKKAVDAMKQCKSEWCYETLIREAEGLLKEIDDKYAEIEQLKFRRAVLLSSY